MRTYLQLVASAAHDTGHASHTTHFTSVAYLSAPSAFAPEHLSRHAVSLSLHAVWHAGSTPASPLLGQAAVHAVASSEHALAQVAKS